MMSKQLWARSPALNQRSKEIMNKLSLGCAALGATLLLAGGLAYGQPANKL